VDAVFSGRHQPRAAPAFTAGRGQVDRPDRVVARIKASGDALNKSLKTWQMLRPGAALCGITVAAVMRSWCGFPGARALSDFGPRGYRRTRFESCMSIAAPAYRLL